MASISLPPEEAELGLIVEDLSDAELRYRRDTYGQCAGAVRDEASGLASDDTFFPARTITREEASKACAECPVRAECLELALREEARSGRKPEGVFGGMTPQDRRKLLKTDRWLKYAAPFPVRRRVAARKPRAIAAAVSCAQTGQEVTS